MDQSHPHFGSTTHLRNIMGTKSTTRTEYFRVGSLDINIHCGHLISAWRTKFQISRLLIGCSEF